VHATAIQGRNKPRLLKKHTWELGRIADEENGSIVPNLEFLSDEKMQQSDIFMHPVPGRLRKCDA
jgi:hypothetical protein